MVIGGSCGGPTGQELIAPELCNASRLLGGRPGRFGGPEAFGFFLEKRIDVRRPTSDASVDAVAVISIKTRKKKSKKGGKEEKLDIIHIPVIWRKL